MVIFTRVSAPAYDPATDTMGTATVTTITGKAIQVRGQPLRFQALGLTMVNAVTLFFTPTAYTLRANTTDFVRPGDVVTWAGRDFTCQDVDPIAPDGIVIAARIIVSE